MWVQNRKGDFSNSSGAWWKEILRCLAAYYEMYLSSSHVGKLALKPETYESEGLKDPKWARVDKRAAAMILGSVPETVKERTTVGEGDWNATYARSYHCPLPPWVCGRAPADPKGFKGGSGHGLECR